MFGISKKRFLITLGLALGIWGVSSVYQAFFTFNTVNYGAFIFAKSCHITGYPVAKCIPEYKGLEFLVYYFINILFWFLLITLIWKFIRR